MTTPISPQNRSALRTLAERYPWPEQRPDFRPIDWSLDGGGRWLVEKKIRPKSHPIVLEIGCFLGGSIRNWLSASPHAQVVAVDPWPESWDAAEYARRYDRPQWEIEQLSRDDGFYQSFLAALWDQRKRVIPVREYSPDILRTLSDLGLRPDVIFLDSDKVGTEIEICRELFPGAIMTGDDWGWRNEAGEYPIREPVQRFCQQNGRYLKVENATWVIDTDPPSVAFRLRTLRRSLKRRLREIRRGAAQRDRRDIGRAA